MMSGTVMPSLASWSGFTHNRIAYWPAPKTCTLPIHGIDAAHLLLDRRRDRLLNRERVRAGVVRLHLNLRRGDLRILRDRERENAHAADERHQNRDDDRDNGPPDKKLRHLLGLLLL